MSIGGEALVTLESVRLALPITESVSSGLPHRPPDIRAKASAALSVFAAAQQKPSYLALTTSKAPIR